ncbi:unnamed protein product [Blepharisma stoltei]|uniref:phosphoglycerate mutase (2,3-diphosphoglycerate-dependent) n=1 Tax=Blepharisma stoltei TaxID=1481888 RepID=A0AAU9IT25_9CILI|nr:unnamed protein product [Blepharisma stoltei]
MSKVSYLVLVRSGNTVYYEEQKYAGWADVALSENGVNAAREAANLIRASGIRLDTGFTSMLKRGVHTMNIIIDELDINSLKVHKHWRLNTRHYGKLEGLNKESGSEIALNDDVRPPLLDLMDDKHPSHETKYQFVPLEALPGGESMNDCKARIIPYWQDKIAPALLKGKNVLVVSHGHSIKALRNHLGDVEGIEALESTISAGIPRVLEFNQRLEITAQYNLSN